MKKLNTLDKILLLSYISLTIFTVVMTVIFCFKDSVPDTLVVSFFAVFTGEAGFCTYIWKHKIKKKNIEEGLNDSSDDI